MGGVASGVASVVSGVAGEGAKFLGNAVGEISGANRAADAAQAAASAQAAEARRQREAVLDQGKKNQQQAMALAEASPQELGALGRAYQDAGLALDRENRLLSAIDPALMEASQQALKLLRGETADINKPMNDLRASQRQQLVNSLRSQYGPGAESSSIGQRALQQFDMESNAMFAQNQQSSLAQAFGIASQDFGGRLTRGIGTMQQVGQGYGALQERKLNTQINTGNALLGALSGTQQQMIQAAGAPYVGEALRAQAQQGLFNMGTQAGLAYLTGGTSLAAGGGAKPGIGAQAGGSYLNTGSIA